MEEAAYYLGFASHDMPILIQVGLLKPLGHPPMHATKYFATVTLEQLRGDLKWLARASDAIVQHWRRKNCAPERYERADLNGGGELVAAPSGEGPAPANDA